MATILTNTDSKTIYLSIDATDFLSVSRGNINDEILRRANLASQDSGGITVLANSDEFLSGNSKYTITPAILSAYGAQLLSSSINSAIFGGISNSSTIYTDSRILSLSSTTSALVNTTSGILTNNYTSLVSSTSGTLQTNITTVSNKVSGYYNSNIDSIVDNIWNNGKSFLSGTSNVTFGDQVLFGLTNGYSNVGIGFQSLANNQTGYENVAIGLQSLFSGTNPRNCIALGMQSCYYTSNTDNIGIGTQALKNNTSGMSNIGIGYNALINSTGSNNVGIGNAANIVSGISYVTQIDTGTNSTPYTMQYRSNRIADVNGLAIYQGSNITLTKGTTGITINSVSGFNYDLITGNTSLNGIILSGTNNFCAGGGNFNFAGNTGNNNVGIGADVFTKTNTGSFNIGIGWSALNSNTNGQNNCALGQGALKDNNVGSYNLALGNSSLTRNTSGNENISIGNNSTPYNKTGSTNIAIGTGTLYYNTSGSNNIALGNRSLNLYNYGSNNICLGTSAQIAPGVISGATQIDTGINTYYDTMQYRSNRIADVNGLAITQGNGIIVSKSTTGITISNPLSGFYTDGNLNPYNTFANGLTTLNGAANIAYGLSAMANAGSSSSSNVALGVLVLNNCTATTNFGAGDSALFSSTTGNDNIAIGFRPLYKNTIGNANIALGSTSLFGNTSGYDNIAFGDSALYNNVTGFCNIALGYKSLYDVTGKHNIGIGAYSNVGTTTVSAVQIGTGTNNVDNTVQFQNNRIADSNGLSISGQMGSIVSVNNSLGNGSIVGLNLRPPTPPNTSTSNGLPGEITDDATYVYICYDTNKWVRITKTSW